MGTASHATRTVCVCVCNSLFEIKIALWTVHGVFRGWFFSRFPFFVAVVVHICVVKVNLSSSTYAIPFHRCYDDIKEEEKISFLSRARSEHHFCRFCPIFIHFCVIFFAVSLTQSDGTIFDDTIAWADEMGNAHSGERGFFHYCFLKQLSPLASSTEHSMYTCFMTTQFNDLEFLWPNTSKCE